MSFREGQVTLSQSPKTDLNTVKAVDHFPVQILSLLAKWVQIKVEPSHLDHVT